MHTLTDPSSTNLQDPIEFLSYVTNQGCLVEVTTYDPKRNLFLFTLHSTEGVRNKELEAKLTFADCERIRDEYEVFFL
jgi:hypothetical protein